MQSALVEPARAPPIDRCNSDASFVTFRDQLSHVVNRKDVAALRRLVDEDIQISLGNGGQGWSEFVRYWELDRPENSGLWLELSAVLRLGCDEYERWRIAPGNFRKLSEFDGLPPCFPS